MGRNLRGKVLPCYLLSMRSASLKHLSHSMTNSQKQKVIALSFVFFASISSPFWGEGDYHDKKNFNLMSPSERRNSLGCDRLYVGPANEGYKFLKGLYSNEVNGKDGAPVLIDGMQGTAFPAEDAVSIGG